jgi:hypothetical protein
VVAAPAGVLNRSWIPKARLFGIRYGPDGINLHLKGWSGLHGIGSLITPQCKTAQRARFCRASRLTQRRPVQGSEIDLSYR